MSEFCFQAVPYMIVFAVALSFYLLFRRPKPNEFQLMLADRAQDNLDDAYNYYEDDSNFHEVQERAEREHERQERYRTRLSRPNPWLKRYSK